MQQTKKQKKNSNVFIIIGSDTSAVREKASELVNGLNPNNDPLKVETITADRETIDEICQSLQSAIGSLLTISFWERMVWLKNAEFLSDSVVVKSPAISPLLEKLISVLRAGLPAGCKFLLSAPGADKRLAEVKELLNLGEVIECNKPNFGWEASEDDIIQWIIQEADKFGIQLDDEAAETLYARIGTDPAQLKIELEKLSLCDKDKQNLTAEVIRQVVPPSRQSGIFDLSNAILKRDLSLALSITDQLLSQKESPLGLLLAAITPTFRNLLLVKSLMIKHRLPPPQKAFFFSKTLEKLPSEEIDHLPRKKDGTLNAYPLGLAAIAAEKYSLNELKSAYLQCRNANLKLLTTGQNPEMVLTNLLAQTITPSQKS
ncbi:MAG: DNA polymerase III subunit delta [Chthoniobacterales bacterium]|nr:DNA polymerase III subunit delta [Chthoniobacterales bacterium]